MTDEERDIITHFIERVSGATRALPQGSVPTTVTALPPVDPEADRLIADLFARYPEARYRLTQTAFVQEHALAEAQTRIQQLQTALQQAQQAQPQQAQPAGGGFFHTLFGGGQAQGQTPPPQPQPYQPYPAAPAPQYAPPQYAQPQYAPPPPQYAPPGGMFQRSGSGFLGSALTTAAGVAGGLVAGNALMNLFDGNRGEGFGGGFGGGYENRGFDQGYAAPGPWADPAPPDAQLTGSAWDNATESAPAAGWDQSQSSAPDAGWADQGGQDTGGGWDDNSGGGGGSGTF